MRNHAAIAGISRLIRRQFYCHSLWLGTALALVPVVALADVAVSPAATPIQVDGGHVAALRNTLNVVSDDTSVFGVDETPAAVGATLRAAGAKPVQITDMLLTHSPPDISVAC